MMKRLLLIALGLMLCGTPALAQKMKVKDKELKKKDKRFEAVVKPAAEYAGRYISGDDFYIEVSVDGSGNLSLVSVEGQRRARLQDAKLEGATLTGVRVYEDGSTQPFTATFANRIMNGTSVFGVIVESSVQIDQTLNLNRLFYRRE